VGRDDGTFKKVADNGSNIVKGWDGLGCFDHTIERSVLQLWEDESIKEIYSKGKAVVTFFRSSTIGKNKLIEIQNEMYGKPLPVLEQECKTRWSSTQKLGISLMRSQDSIQTYSVRQQMKDSDGKDLKMGYEDWEIIGEATASLTTIAGIVKQAEGDKYVTASLVLPFVNSCLESLSPTGIIKQQWLSDTDKRKQFPASSCHKLIKDARVRISDDLESRWITGLSLERREFYLVASILDPRTKDVLFCNDEFFPSSWKKDAEAFLKTNLLCFYGTLPGDGDDALGNEGGPGGVQPSEQRSLLADLLGSSGRLV
jgi:hypothetical protein